MRATGRLSLARAASGPLLGLLLAACQNQDPGVRVSLPVVRSTVLAGDAVPAEPAVAAVCRVAFDRPVSPGEVTAPYTFALAKENAEPPDWRAFQPFVTEIPFSLGKTRSVICIRERWTSVGTYPDGTGATVPRWHVAAVALPAGITVARLELDGGSPPQVKRGLSSGSGELPLHGLFTWFSGTPAYRGEFLAPPWHPYELAFSRSGRVIAVANGTNVVLFDRVTRERLGQTDIPGELDQVSSLAFGDGDRLLVGMRSGSVLLWEDVKAAPRTLWSQPQRAIEFLAISPAGDAFVTPSDDPKIVAVHALPGGAARTLARLPEPLDGVAFSPDGRTLATISRFETRVRFFDAGSGAERGVARGSGGGFCGIDYAPGGRLYAVMNRKGLTQVREVGTNRVLASIQLPPSFMFVGQGLAFVRDGRLAVHATGGTWIVDTGSWKVLKALSAQFLGVVPDGSAIACSSENGLLETIAVE